MRGRGECERPSLPHVRPPPPHVLRVRPVEAPGCLQRVAALKATGDRAKGKLCEPHDDGVARGRTKNPRIIPGISEDGPVVTGHGLVAPTGGDGRLRKGTDIGAVCRLGVPSIVWARSKAAEKRLGAMRVQSRVRHVPAPSP